jgi:predicted GNAT family N-acyltransferase
MPEGETMVTFKYYDYLCREAHDIRIEVFVEEQGFRNEIDDNDDRAIHVVLFENGVPAATGRLFAKNKDTYIIGRVAVRKQYRNSGLGKKVVGRLEDRARELGGRCVELSSQCRVRNFYEKMGYFATGETYLNEFCEHIHMRKYL